MSSSRSGGGEKATFPCATFTLPLRSSSGWLSGILPFDFNVSLNLDIRNLPQFRNCYYPEMIELSLFAMQLRWLISDEYAAVSLVPNGDSSVMELWDPPTFQNPAGLYHRKEVAICALSHVEHMIFNGSSR